MQFHLGKPILVMLIVSLVSGAIVLLRRSPARADVAVWTFAEPHARVYRPLIPQFERQYGRSLEIDLVGERALNERLVSLFAFGRGGADLPDAVEIGMGQIGKFFGPPVGEIGFLPLNSYLKNTGFREIRTEADPGRAGWNARLRTDGKIYSHDGVRWALNPALARPDAWIDRIPRSRFAPWTRAGVIFGVPRDVHPVTLTYRADLYDAFKRDTGGDIEAVATWKEFHRLALDFQRYWTVRGEKRYAIELQQGWPDHLVTLLLQRGVNPIDAQGGVHLVDRKVVETVAFYARMVAGPDRVAADALGNPGLWAKDVVDGRVCAFLTPDWRVSDLRRYAPAAAGKMRMRELPRFDPADPPTSTLSGTMIGIPRQCRDPDAAWKIVEFLYLSDAGLDARMGAGLPASTADDAPQGDILPPVMDYWEKPEFHQPDAYFGGQRIKELYIRLARQIPPQTVTPASAIANGYLAYVMSLASEYVRDRGSVGLENYVADKLRAAQADLVTRITQMQF